jgi:DNA-binding protein HU-beta
MNKGDLINEVAKVTGTKKEAQAAVDCVFDAITKALKDKDQVTVFGFGAFKVNNRKARMGRKLKTDEPITIEWVGVGPREVYDIGANSSETTL